MPPRKNKPQPEYKCDDCQFGTWKQDERYMTPEGLPIFLRCPHYRNGKVSIIRGSKACHLFKQKS